MRDTILFRDTQGDIERAAAMLLEGELIAFPTETVYGLGADATNEAAVMGIYKAKGRPARNPLIIHVADATAARHWAASWPHEAQRLAGLFWPGPLTLVVPAAPGLTPAALAGGNTVGLRAPDHPVALALLRECGIPLAAPSANRSGSLSPTRAEHVLEDLGGLIGGIVDGGPCNVGIESTVIDLCEEEPRLLRPGGIPRAAIEEALGRPVASAPTPERNGDDPLRSPGLFERHYAPSIPLKLVEWEEWETAGDQVARIDLGHDPESAATRLYDALWRGQASGASEIWVLNPPNYPAWEAIRDRLRRASVRG